MQLVLIVTSAVIMSLSSVSNPPHVELMGVEVGKMVDTAGWEVDDVTTFGIMDDVVVGFTHCVRSEDKI